MKRNRACEICGNDTDLSAIKKIRYHLPSAYKIPSQYEIVSCDKCGFCFANVLATISDYNDYYARYNYYCERVLTNVPDNLSQDAVIDLFCTICKKDDKILDIGFGKGEHLLLLQKHGFRNLFGIDPSKESVENIQKFGICAEIGNVYELNSWKEKMDMVIITDVLEHLLKPSFALENIGKVLSDGGLLYVSVPNCLNFEKDVSPVCNNFNQEHINYFSITSLKNLMLKYGFLEEKIITEEKYTDIFAVFRYHKDKATNFIKKDVQTALVIKAYLKYNDQREVLYNQKLGKYVKDHIPVAVWGTGAFTMSLLSNTELKHCRIECFIDNNPMKWGSVFWGKSVISADRMNSYPQIEAVFIVSIRSSTEIKEQLLKMGWEDKRILVFA